MPLFFFHIRDQDELYEDGEGIDLPDLHAALDEALRTNRELMREPVEWEGFEFEINDSEGRTLLRMPVQQVWLHEPSFSTDPAAYDRRCSAVGRAARKLH